MRGPVILRALRRARTLLAVYKVQLAAGLLALVLLEVGLLMVETHKIENEIGARIENSLGHKGFGRISVAVRGRDVVLGGQVSSQTGNFHATSHSLSVYGVRRVDSQLNISPLRLPHLIVSRDLEDVLRLDGEVPVQNQADRLAGLLVSSVRHESVINSLRVNPEVTDPGWIDLVFGILHEANQLSGIDIEIGAGKLALGGLADGQSNYNVLVQRIRHFISGSGLEFINRVGIRPAVAVALPDPVSSQVVTAGINVVVAPESENSAASGSSGLDSDKQGYDITEAAISRLADDATIADTAMGESDTYGSEGDTDSPAEVLTIVRTDFESPKIEICQQRVNNVLKNNRITFPPNVVLLPVYNSIIVKNIAEILTECPTSVVTVEGHTDSSGSEESNNLLSQMRAESVKKHLQIQGIDASRIMSYGFGSSKPVASNETRQGRNLNRRIEITLAGG